MSRPRWLYPGWWRYLRDVYPDRLAVFGVLGALLLGFAGYASVAALGNGTPTVGAPVTLTTKQSVVSKRPATWTRIAAGGVVDPRTVYQRQAVLLDGKAVTISRVVTDPLTTTVVKPRTFVQSETAPGQTVIRSQTGPTQTVTVTGPTTTVTRTVVVTTTSTVTKPALTVTVTLPIP